MNKEVKEKWVAALRSGEYTQVVGRLRRADFGPKCMCALGVLVDVVGGWADQEAENEGAVLVPAVLEKAGLPGYYGLSPSVHCEGVQYRVSELNDVHGLSFNQLADLLEAS